MKTDARVRYTRHIIQQVFLEFLQDKPITAITVKEICDKAEVNRGTFYKHYKDCFDLLDQIEGEALAHLEEILSAIDRQGIQPVMMSILAVLQKHADLFQVLLERGRDRSFLYRLTNCCFKYFDLQIPNSKDEPKRMMRFTFLCGGVSSVIEYWLCSGMREPPSEVANMIGELTAHMGGTLN